MLRDFWDFLLDHKAAVCISSIVVIIFIAFSGVLVYDNRYKSPKAETQGLTFEKEDIVVTVTGAVNQPGIYKLEGDSRLNDLLEKAGGTMESADLSKLNLAEKLVDEAQIVIPTIVTEPEPPADAKTADGKINLNTADETTLCELYGVGPKTAQKIIAFREQNGGFQSVEQLLEQKLVNKKVYADIKDEVTV